MSNQRRYDVIPLLLDPDGDDHADPCTGFGSGAVAINEQGVVIGNLAASGQRSFPWRWVRTKALCLGAGTEQGRAAGINASGLIVGLCVPPRAWSAACAWTEGGAELLPVPDGATDSGALGVSDGGLICSTVHLAPRRAARYVACLWDHDEPRFLLDDGRYQTWAAGVADDGCVVGYVSRGQQAFAAVWRGAWTLVPLPDGQTHSRARAVNTKGQVVGGANDQAGRPYGWVWDGRRVEVLPPPSGFYGTEAWGINDLGHVVGTARADPGELKSGPWQVGCLWVEGEVFNLDERLSGLSRWYVMAARGINDRGQIVAAVTDDLTTVSSHAAMLSPVGMREDFQVGR